MLPMPWVAAGSPALPDHPDSPMAKIPDKQGLFFELDGVLVEQARLTEDGTVPFLDRAIDADGKDRLPKIAPTRPVSPEACRRASRAVCSVQRYRGSRPTSSSGRRAKPSGSKTSAKPLTYPPLSDQV